MVVRFVDPAGRIGAHVDVVARHLKRLMPEPFLDDHLRDLFLNHPDPERVTELVAR